MTTALAERTNGPIAPHVTPEQLALVKKTVASGATDAELQLYLYDCQRHGVHPLDKLLHFTKRDGRYTPITSIDLMRIRAAETGEMAGNEDPTYISDDDGQLISATVTVHRLTQGQRFPYTATARWSEYCPDAGPSGKGDRMWKKMPHTMLGKCAEALALRKGFPKQLAGLYAREEMAQAETTREPQYTVEAPKRIELPEGTCQITNVIPKRQGPAEYAEVTYVDHLGVEHTAPTSVEMKSAAPLCEQLAQEAVPVTITTKQTPRSKKTVIAEIHRWQAPTPPRPAPVSSPTPMTADEVPF